ncbi:MAG: non-homologous end-joining DNA ligase [Clostridia bacterium]|nr:non-homologous end-joining DNA ligase [Clostridia bacterium]
MSPSASAGFVADGVRLTNLDKVLWPSDGTTKGQLVAYYASVARALLPHLRGRPLVVTRYPEGIGRPGFYQKRPPPGTPPWVRTFASEREGRPPVRYVVCDDEATLVWLANLAAIELHPWAAPCARPACPDFALVDLDPMPPATFDDAREVALVLGDHFRRLGVAAFLKTSGARGLHIYLPIEPGPDHREVTLAVRRLATLVRRAWPEKVTLERARARRAGRVYVDYLQNQRGHTLCAPYSLRARPGAPASCPVAWGELTRLRPADFTIRTVPRRLAVAGDPWADILRCRQPLPALDRARLFA